VEIWPHLKRVTKELANDDPCQMWQYPRGADKTAAVEIDNVWL